MVSPPGPRSNRLGLKLLGIIKAVNTNLHFKDKQLDYRTYMFLPPECKYRFSSYFKLKGGNRQILNF